MKIWKKAIIVAISIMSMSFVLPVINSDMNLINYEVNASSIKLSEIKYTIVEGKTYTLKVTGTKRTIEWSTSDKSIATVNSKGKITAKKAGTATITAKIGKEKYKCKITVESAKPAFKKVSETVYATCNVNVRALYSKSSKQIGSLKKGESIKRIGIGSNGWDRVSYNGKTAYINHGHLSKEPIFEKVSETVYATGNINIRASYGKFSELLGGLKKGESIKRIGIGSNGWDRVSYNGKTAYINHDHLSKEPIFETVTEIVFVTCNVNVRASYSKSSEQLNSLPKGKAIERIGIGSNGWDRILYNGRIAYINHSHLTTESSKYVIASMDSADKYGEEWLVNFNLKIIELQDEFPKGKYWNHAGSAINGSSVTNTPCNHKVNGRKYCNSYYGNAYPGRTSSVQCLGFASMLSDRVFGSEANATKFYNYDDIKIGDQARINNNSHSVFIIDKTDDYVVVAECNADYKTCVINWGRKIPRNKLAGWYVTRWE